MNEMPPSIDLWPDSERGFHKEIRFSPSLTALCLLVCVCGFVVLLWSVSATEVELGITASRDLERLASRLLGFESRLSELSSLERGLFRLWGEVGDSQEQIREWYEELPHEQRNPLDELYAGILHGEAEVKTDLRQSMAMWGSEDPPLPTFRRFLEVGYLGNNGEHIDFDTLQARLAEEVPSNWFYYQLAKRLALQSGDQTLQESVRYQFQLLTDPQLWKWRVLVILELTLGGIGFMYLVFLVSRWFRRRADLTIEPENQRIASWTFHEGLAVLVRGGALSIVLIVLVATIPYGIIMLEDYGSLLLYVPTVVLIMVLLCWPKNQSFLEVLGCQYPLRHLQASFPILLGVTGLGFMGDWMIMFGGDWLDISAHWTEWFLPQLVWGSFPELVKTTMEVVVLAPIFEEIIFRGLVFSTLRAKFGFFVSMIGSGMIFALAHGYGPMAFLTVFWSGLLWAWLYERTGSLVPGMCAHAINNGLVVYFLVGIFR